jgi:dinuclear metal center YbgI/SA1388 family protein
MTASSADLVAYMNHYLQVDQFSDYGPQGLQVEGRPDVDCVVTGVSACLALFEAAVEHDAQMVLVHHGILWDRESRVLGGSFKRRVKALLEADLNLAAYHLCLDAHAVVGNNALAARELDLEDLRTWGPDRPPIGWCGDWRTPVTPAEAIGRVESLFGPAVFAFMDGPAEVRRVAIVSGGAQRLVGYAAENGVDLFITGEASEFVMHTAREARIHFIAAGHHNTERLGIRALGDHIALEFGIRHEFVDIPNPV